LVLGVGALPPNPHPPIPNPQSPIPNKNTNKNILKKLIKIYFIKNNYLLFYLFKRIYL